MIAADLFEPIERHDLERVRGLLDEGADANACQAQWPRFTPLKAAIEELEYGGPLAMLTLLLEHGAEVNDWGPDRDAPPLLMAIFRDQRVAARLLLEAGADPNVRGAEGDSPLRWCVQGGDLDLVELILRSGGARSIDEIGQPGGRSALGIAAAQLSLPMIRVLRAHGASTADADEDLRPAYKLLPPREQSNIAEWDQAIRLLTEERD